MKGIWKRLLGKTKSFIRRNLATRPGRGSGLGVSLRRLARRLNPQQIIGVNLAGIAFFAGIVLPQTQAVVSSVEVAIATMETVVVADTAPSTYQWPLTRFGISQGFSYYHPALDLTDPKGTPVYPIADGVVNWVESVPFGYGNHILISHDRDIKSLYAHLSTIAVSEGQRVTKKTELGLVGTTGHATGSHLHLEIYQHNTPLNPMEILPLLKSITPTVSVPPTP